MELLKPAQLSRKVLAPPRGTVPYPLLKENTLVVSDQLTLVRRRGGRLELSARVGDVYPNQVRGRAALSRFCPTMVRTRRQPLSLRGFLHADRGSLWRPPWTGSFTSAMGEVCAWQTTVAWMLPDAM